MDYLTAMECNPVYEFPYSGYQPCSTPLFNDNINTLLSSINPPIGDQCCYQPPTITLNCVPQINSNVCNRETLVYQAPENMPIETILQELGVNVNTIQRTGSLDNCYRNVCDPMEVTILSPSRRRRRRLVCHEVSDSEDDHYYRRRPPRHRSYDPDSLPDRPDKSPTAIHDVLSNVWNKARTVPERLPRSSSDPNIARQWEAMRNYTPPPSSNANMNKVWQSMRSTPPPPPPSSNANMDRIWRAMQNTPPPSSNANMNKVWQSMRNAPPSPNPATMNAWQAMRNAPPSPNPATMNAWQAMRNAPPSPNPATMNAWQAMRNAPPSPNPATMNAWEAMRNAPPSPNPATMNAWQAMRNAPSSPNPAAMNAWEAMRNASPPMSPYGQTAVTNAWQNANNASQQQANSIARAFNLMQQSPGNVIQPPPRPNPAVQNAWSRASLASPSMANNPWNRMPTPGFPYPSGGLPPGTPNPSRAPAPRSFAALLSQAQRQHLPYAGAM
ncbi:unnamed protein product [Rotaria sp. Silwood2]|nr:unnamed protein product [Rotaria sp. Silwood2]CAF3157671.1 unnamed protein product [Rotaria sp. Silwood2]